ncbi:hypothetical protein B0T24DRAFT_600218 [Lasiosphaeria ovina]|uniref:Uncharacterized protein n=1 Tax=Lasiosphaeria ovina TaxID=92902 RepID=A0AAE0MXA1_9PEZI|nr:hypothetical protein B0T24DRAFT_600218 [Lasiosphaeria ovina]
MCPYMDTAFSSGSIPADSDMTSGLTLGEMPVQSWPELVAAIYKNYDQQAPPRTDRGGNSEENTYHAEERRSRFWAAVLKLPGKETPSESTDQYAVTGQFYPRISPVYYQWRHLTLKKRETENAIRYANWMALYDCLSVEDQMRTDVDDLTVAIIGPFFGLRMSARNDELIARHFTIDQAKVQGCARSRIEMAALFVLERELGLQAGSSITDLCYKDIHLVLVHSDGGQSMSMAVTMTRVTDGQVAPQEEGLVQGETLLRDAAFYIAWLAYLDEALPMPRTTTTCNSVSVTTLRSNGRARALQWSEECLEEPIFRHIHALKKMPSSGETLGRQQLVKRSAAAHRLKKQDLTHMARSHRAMSKAREPMDLALLDVCLEECHLITRHGISPPAHNL